MTKINGPCSYDKCEILHGEELVVEPCTVYQKAVHHLCSNILLDGSLDVRVCSVICRDRCARSPLTALSDGSSMQQRASMAANKHTKKRPAALKPGPKSKKVKPSRRAQASDAASLSNQMTAKVTKSRRPRASDSHLSGPVPACTEDRSPTLSSAHGSDISGEATTFDNTQENATLVGAICTIGVSGFVKKRGVRAQDAERLQNILGESDDDTQLGNADVGVPGIGGNADEGACENDEASSDHSTEAVKASMTQPKKKGKGKHQQGSKQEVLSIEPYAGGYGHKTQRYEQVAEYLSEHLKVTLCDRTVKDRLDLLLAEFKRDDQSYRKKSGVDELHTEHKRLLQDISDRMRDVEVEKKKKKDRKKEKATALQTQGGILRDQAVTRRSERGDAATEASEDSTDTGERTSDANKPHTETQGSTTSMLNSAGMIGAFMDFQNENRESNRQFQSEQIEVLKYKASADASRWEQEFAFKKKQEMINENRWKEEELLRREEMELRKAELQLLRDQFEAQQRTHCAQHDAQPE
ncbi:hypothetical protein PF008_g10846 [Phytophthora fragariae]|uniref:Uncharacterized protein n=1 Tax=Phytophthora fragariae TaxID=53985 RepID=A0A6G0RSF7_9STRA|nr:hypothetical protein PF008_g10846 [Phytophthora fragariae]